MSDSEQPTPEDANPCGNCGALTQLVDVTCPSCGVLLAAYLAPRGATGASLAPATSATVTTAGDTSATHDVPSPSMTADPAGGNTTVAPMYSTPSFTTPALESSPFHQPKSRSPMSDALQGPGDRPGSGNDAVGTDELTKMADGKDELSHMASGSDELAEMAAGGGASLTKQIEAELAGARVTFDGDEPVIDSDQIAITQTPGSEPSFVETRTGSNRVPGVDEVTTSQSAERRGLYDQTISGAVGDSDQRGSSSGHGSGFDPNAVVRWLPFVLIGLFILGFGRSLPGMGGVIGFVLVAGLIYLLLKWTAASSRKTTSMPRDESWNRKKRR